MKTDLGISKALSGRGKILPKIWPTPTNKREIPGGSWMSERRKVASNMYGGPKEEWGPL